MSKLKKIFHSVMNFLAAGLASELEHNLQAQIILETAAGERLGQRPRRPQNEQLAS